MSAIPVCVYRFGRIITETNGNCASAIANRYAAYSSYRNIWNNMVNRKGAPAAASTSSEKSNAAESQNKEEVQSKKADDELLKIEIKELNKRIEELKQENLEIMDKYKRALADGENLRMRLTKQIEEAKIFGIQGFCKDLLEVADVLGKATECVPKEEVSDSNPHLKNLYEGLTMTETELKRVFTRHGLVPLNPINEKFDPNAHEALFQQEVAGKEAGTVVVVSKIGYKLQERVIRPALVGVSK